MATEITYSFTAEWNGHKIIQGDTLQVMQQLPSNYFDSIITDPPYCSGGASLASKQVSTAAKYLEVDNLPDFEGDSKDQRSWTRWMTEWLREGRRVLKQGGIVGCFIDWRMLPAMTDALQFADFCWKGIFVWDKSEGVRPHKGRFRSQCEYFVWGCKGNLPINRNAPVLPGCITVTTKTQNKLHQTEKPLELMYTLVKITEKGGRVLDPFCGSGSTVVAAKHMGYSAVGIEISSEYCKVAEKRLRTELAQQRFDFCGGGGQS